MNKIVAQLQNDNRFQISLYMDDLQKSYCHPNWRATERKLQESLYIVKNFVQKNGIMFSASKTSILLFTKLSTPPSIELRLGNIRIQRSETVKNLGLVFYSKLDWNAYIQ